jgi:hypothetical protein
LERKILLEKQELWVHAKTQSAKGAKGFFASHEDVKGEREG